MHPTFPTLPASGIITLAALESQGFTAARRAALLAGGRLFRIRNGWFAAVGANAEQVRAVRIGGRLTCGSALRQYGVWVMPDARLHVAVRGNASRLRSPDDRRKPWRPSPGVCLHWNDERMVSGAGASIDSGTSIDTVAASIAHLILCTDRDTAIVSIDSALNGTAAGHPLLTIADLSDILGQLPAKYWGLAELVDVGSQSGLETLARLRLRRLGLRVRTQAKIPRVGRVDVLVGDRLVLELDSRSHHLGDNYEKDRDRDLELFRQGFAVVRVSYRRVLHEWPSIEDAILAAVRRGEHRRRAMHERLGLATLA